MQGFSWLWLGDVADDRRAPCSIKVIRILRQLVGLSNDYRLFKKFGIVFSKNLDFSTIKPIF